MTLIENKSILTSKELSKAILSEPDDFAWNDLLFFYFLRNIYEIQKQKHQTSYQQYPQHHRAHSISRQGPVPLLE